MSTNSPITLRALERADLPFIHGLNNNRSVMAYWFEEPYESLDELSDLYEKHIHDDSERRFIVENQDGQLIGLVELVEINHVHSIAEFAIMVAPTWQGKGFARNMIRAALDYAFNILNLHKVYLIVDEDNEKAMHLYLSVGFREEGRLVEEYFTNGRYQNVIRMYILQREYLTKDRPPHITQ